VSLTPARKNSLPGNRGPGGNETRHPAFNYVTHKFLQNFERIRDSPDLCEQAFRRLKWHRLLFRSSYDQHWARMTTALSSVSNLSSVGPSADRRRRFTRLVSGQSVIANTSLHGQRRSGKEVILNDTALVVFTVASNASACHASEAATFRRKRARNSSASPAVLKHKRIASPLIAARRSRPIGRFSGSSFAQKNLPLPLLGHSVGHQRLGPLGGPSNA
jgi:hypothetical protein